MSDDPIDSSDLHDVNNELRRRGFSPTVYFGFDQDSLTATTRDQLARNARLLKPYPQLTVTIEGHTDSRGLNEYNIALGERRAVAVKTFLVSLGVSDARLLTISYGEERPVCEEEDESCWQQNRRVQMAVTGRER